MNQLMMRLGCLLTRIFPEIADSLEDFAQQADKSAIVSVTTAASANGGSTGFVHIDYFTFTVAVEGLKSNGRSLRYSRTLLEVLPLHHYCSANNPDAQLVNLKLLVWSVDTARYLQHLGFTVEDPVVLPDSQLEELYEQAGEHKIPVSFPFDTGTIG